MGSRAARPNVPMTIVECRDEAIGLGANAQRRRKRDTHELNALRTLFDRCPPPGAPIPSNSLQLNAHCQTRLFRDAAKKRKGGAPVPCGSRKFWLGPGPA